MSFHWAEDTYGGELLDVLLGCSQTGQADLLRELGERRVSEEGDVTQQLVTHVAAHTHTTTRLLPLW